MKQVLLKRIYDAVAEDDGFRVLVDRLWPRGIKKENARVDLWVKDIAPSNDLRKWFGHDAAKFDAFADRYRAELTDSAAFADLCRRLETHDVVTLLFAAKDTEHNNAVVLRHLLTEALGSSSNT